MWERIRNLAPDRPAAWSRGSVPLLMAGRLDEAEALLNEGMQRFPAFAGACFHHAEVANFRKDWAEADRRWGQCCERWPNAAGFFEERARVNLKLGRERFAEELLSRALELEPHRLSAKVEWLRLSDRRISSHEAAEQWDKLIAAAPTDTKTHRVRPRQC